MFVNDIQDYPGYWFSFIQIILVLFLLGPVNAKTSYIKPHNHNPVHGAPNGAQYNSYQPYNTIFDVLSFGAKGDGVADDTKAFLAAWQAACPIGSATIEIPSEFRFLVGPITLQGPCIAGLVLQIDGTIIAPRNPSKWPKPGLLQWINVKNLHGFTIQGSGTVDGQGSEWWILPEFQLNWLKQLAIRFYTSSNVTIRDIWIQNSPQCHLKFDNCTGVKVSNITISSPADSPNTDGIHLQNSKWVELESSSISCGDDCISIQTGCSNVNIHHIRCGPGHGMSIGGLGKDGSLACVSDIVIQNSTMHNTLYGVRIKTWQGGVGSVESVIFSNIQVSNVKIPIAIDQFYCDRAICLNKTDAVAVSNITYNQINGTYTTQSAYLACSNTIPCTNISMNDVLLTPLTTTAWGLKKALCWNSYGKTQPLLFPNSTDCLEARQPPYRKAPSLNRTNLTC
ncbi:Glycoside hydrolase [Macleaya cordata]|uniref:Glycoside hydrolase n=1 Tax=Macleaya cordata TaxID=56857 RepID=A0A200R258_MACCD|nr:Glycoside hydrolase [Macleaya cordata]